LCGGFLGRADLQLHSDLGDGLSSIEEILDSAEKAGLDVIALTDHDDIRGAFELRELAARRSSPVEIVTGVEVTTRSGHLLALWLNTHVLRVAETGSSDAHHAALVGTCWTEFPGSTTGELRSALQAHATRADGRGWTLREHLDGAAKQQWRSMVRDPVKRARRRMTRSRKK